MLGSCMTSRVQTVRCSMEPARTKNVASNQSKIIDRRALMSSLAALTLMGNTNGQKALADELESAIATISTQDAPPISLFQHLSEPILAYEFDYPSSTSSGRTINLVFSRKPERYSSAAPLAADARQRIVLELVDLLNAVTVSVSVGPPSGTLKTTPQVSWTPRQVAEQVLADRSTARITSGQRVSLSTVEDTTSIEKDGTLYYMFEHISQGSPTLLSKSKETYRHSLAVTAVRPGLDGTPYLYTLNMACPQELWNDLESGFRKGVNSFTLVTPGKDYVAPDQDPWRFF